jgi:HicA toxin of bacterial toxin-antitoxin,
MISTGVALSLIPWHHGAMPKRSSPKRDSGTSHVQLQHDGYRDYTWAWHDSDEIGPVALRKIGKYTGLTPEDL